MLNSFQIKLIAVVTMIIDHIGAFFFPDLIIFRLIGRLSFPLFAWLIASGARHTHNISAYILRIFLLACVSQVPYLLANRLVDASYASLNVLFTFVIGLGVLAVIRLSRNPAVGLLVTAVGAAVAQFLNTDYGVLGIFSIVAFYVFYKEKAKLILAQIIITVSLFFATMAAGDFVYMIQPVSLAALFFIYLYNNKQGPKVKWLFYVFFPLHYLVIYLMLLL